jgi:hypothetical protein
MNSRKLAVVLLFSAFFASGTRAQIKHIEMRVEGMT